MKTTWIILAALLLFFATAVFSQPIIVDHTCIDIFQIPVTAIQSAKADLHIVYGHTSHGSQITSGMSGLVDFMNGKGYEHNLFAYNSDGSAGALQLNDGPLANDVGYYPDWVNETRNFLGTPNAQGRGSSHPTYNVVLWSWCGQLSGYSNTDVYTMYLNDMNQLEQDYPGVTFVYMTGHSDGSGLEGALHQNNQTIRNYCMLNDKVLFDFYDIECYDPDGNYFGDKYVDDACNYDGGNWAQEWQNSHTEGVDWYSCDAAHSEPVNGNMKAYAAWWLWARLGGWAGTTPDLTAPSIPQNLDASIVNETQVDLSWDVSTDAESGVSRYRVYRDGQAIATTTSNTFSDQTCVPGETYQYQVSAINGGGSESDKSVPVEVTLPTDNQPPSTPTGLTANPVSSTEIDLSWDAATDNSAVSGYRVYRDGEQVADVEDTYFSDSGLTPQTGYRYRVSAYDVAGNESSLSDPATATTLDPSQERTTIRLEDTDEVDDTFIYENDPTGNYGGDCCPGEIDRVLVRFNLPAVLSGKHILSANLEFFVWNQSNYHDNETLKIYRMTRSWDEYGATWQNAADGDPWATPGGDADMATPVAQIPQQPDQADWDHAFYPPADITQLVQAWTDGTPPNHGLMVVNDGQTEIGFKASEYDEGSRPYLEIVYTDKPIPSSTESESVSSFELCSNYPNPFNPGTTIQFYLITRENVEIKVYDLQGREIQTLLSGQMDAGQHEVHFAADNLASGVYVYTVRVGQHQMMRKMLLAK
ncbi:DNRLRE domain-containing protein [bacterium]|nr:DNRLRE domain-containing protein [bacterium]